MKKLEIDIIEQHSNTETARIGGLSSDELFELKNMDHKQAGTKLLDILDERNDGIGTTWRRSCGVVSWWFDNEYAYVNISK